MATYGFHEMLREMNVSHTEEQRAKRATAIIKSVWGLTHREVREWLKFRTMRSTNANTLVVNINPYNNILIHKLIGPDGAWYDVNYLQTSYDDISASDPERRFMLSFRKLAICPYGYVLIRPLDTFVSMDEVEKLKYFIQAAPYNPLSWAEVPSSCPTTPTTPTTPAKEG